MTAGRKAQALLAYLALSAGQWHGRDRLAGLLWSERQEARARNSLRQALASIRHLGQGLGVDLVETDGDRVQLPNGVAETDVAAFQELGDSDPIAATRLYAGDLLDGFTAPDVAFQDWLTGERAALREAACQIFERAVSQAANNGDWRKAVELATVVGPTLPSPATGSDGTPRAGGRPGRSDPSVPGLRTAAA